MTIDHLDLNVWDLNLKVTKEFYTQLFVDFLGWEIIYDTPDYFMIGDLPGLRIGFSEIKNDFKDSKFDRDKIGLHHFAIEGLLS